MDDLEKARDITKFAIEAAKNTSGTIKDFCRVNGLCQETIYRLANDDGRSPMLYTILKILHGAGYTLTVTEL